MTTAVEMLMIGAKLIIAGIEMGERQEIYTSGWRQREMRSGRVTGKEEM